MSVLAVVGLAAAVWFVYEPEIAPIARPDKASFDEAVVKRGEQLATVGDCIVCHTADGGKPFAGSRPLPTPFGTLYSGNITPDEATGIGHWSETAFDRAMKQGVARDGSNLYPALPYEHFTHVTDDDLHAVYAFLMTREAVSLTAPANKLIPGLGFRPLLAGWKLLFLHETSVQPDPSQNAEWNRGKYLVEGLAHCGGCHTPRNVAGGEELGSEFEGGVAEGWVAPALTARNPSASTWTQASLFNYLKTGSDENHSAAAGPMAAVTEGLSRLNDPDVKAISVYIAYKMHEGEPSVISDPSTIDNATQAANENSVGAHLFQGACAGCHGIGAPMADQARASLSTVTDLKLNDPTNAAMAILQGVSAPSGKGPYMPPFAGNLTDKEIVELLAYVRSRFTASPAWTKLESSVTSARREAQAQ
ncbi:c-type cytochrome [Rhizobium tubonense]|uniref:c-type cytochrome n=1 Tax=Rhizobium tubonense TaxID=484088 RepID=UPI001FCE749D|nr:cytochrome c [Rhizobium tubonense]